MVIGYCRVSTKDQDLTRQIESLKEYGCEKIYSDKATGKNFNRPEYTKLKDALRKGDTLGAIAKRNGTTVKKLAQLNGIKGTKIRAGQKIRLR